MSRLRHRLSGLVSPGHDDAPLVAHAPAVRVRNILARFWPDLRPYWRWIALSVALAAVMPAIATAEIWLFKLVVDDVLVPGDLGALPMIALAYLGLLVGGAALGFADDYLATWVGERFVLDLRSRVFAHAQTLSAHDIDRRRSGDLVARLNGDVAAVETLALIALTEAVSAVFRILFFGAALLYLDWGLATIALVMAPLFWFTARRFARLVKRAAREKRRRSGSLSAVAQESFGNAALVQAHNGQAAEVERFRREGRGIMAAELAATRIRALFTPLIDLLELAAVLLVIGLGTWAVTQGRLTIGGLMVFLAYLTQLMSPVRSLSSLSNTIFAAAAGAERVIELLDERPRVSDSPTAVAPPDGPGEIVLEGVHHRHGDTSLPTLRGVDLRLAPGEQVALVGPSGAGKSTLAALIARLDDPTAGRVTLDGRDLRELRLDGLRDRIALLAQEAPIVQASAHDNIALGRPGARRDEVVEAARLAGVHRVIEALPQGYDTLLDARGRRLSGGERQRVAIARALLRRAPVVILDEPTTGLDEAAQRALIEPLRRVTDGRTSLVITHDLRVARRADRIVMMEEGRIVESGTYESLMAAGGPFRGLARRDRDHQTAPSLAGVA